MVTTIKANSKNNSGRKYDGGGPRPDNTEIKRKEALERNEAWAKLSPVQQLKALDSRFGEGKGAARQRARIQAKIDRPKKQDVATSAVTSPETTTTPNKVRAKDRRAQERSERPNK